MRSLPLLLPSPRRLRNIQRHLHHGVAGRVWIAHALAEGVQQQQPFGEDLLSAHHHTRHVKSIRGLSAGGKGGMGWGLDWLDLVLKPCHHVAHVTCMRSRTSK